jgi:hypothetical protein
MVRIFVRGFVLDAGGIENNDVREEAGLQVAAFFDF